jgi:protein-disulfide isomerase
VNLEGAPVKGLANAKITIVEFSDFECPYCSRVVPTLSDLFKEYPGQIKLVFKNNPLPMHPRAIPAAKAFLSAGEQGKYWEMHDKLFAEQKDLSDANIFKIAQQLKLNMDQFKKSYLSNKWDARIQAEQKQAQELGMGGTPSFLVNGVSLYGARPKEQFKELIEALLKE